MPQARELLVEVLRLTFTSSPHVLTDFDATSINRSNWYASAFTPDNVQVLQMVPCIYYLAQHMWACSHKGTIQLGLGDLLSSLSSRWPFVPSSFAVSSDYVTSCASRKYTSRGGGMQDELTRLQSSS